jgi:glutathione synthase/RimK-type ligase-like ATP-grasp enzyme
VQNLFRDKASIIEAEKAWGFPIPESCVCHTPDELRAFSLAINGTVTVKPMNGSGGEGVAFLPITTNPAANLTFPLLAQRFIEGQMGVVEMFCS